MATPRSQESTPRHAPSSADLSMQASASVCNWEDEALKAPDLFEFERDLYTSAFISVLKMSGETRLKHGPILHYCGSLFTPCLCLAFVVFIQVFALVGVADFVSTSWDLSLGGYDFVLHDYALTNHTMQIAISQPLCGVFEQMEFHREITMVDGSMYTASDDHPVVAAYKMPGGSWNSRNIVDDKSLLDESLLAVSDDFHTHTPEFIEISEQRSRLTKGGLHEWSSGSVYWLYHYLMSMLLAFVLIVEARKINRFSMMLLHFYRNKKMVPWGEPCCAFHESSGQLELQGLSKGALAAGIGVIVLRGYVVVCLCAASFWLFLLSMSRMDLIFNALALSFILEIDDLVYWAITSQFTRKMVEDLRAIELWEEKAQNLILSVQQYNIITPIAFFCLACVYSVSCRLGQLYMRKEYFAAIASVCMFLGPTPEATSYPVMAPVPGFCESLLQAVCAADVEGPASKNGPCYIADALNVSKQLSSMSEPFEDMFDSSGERRSWVDWGAPKQQLLEAGWDPLAHSQRNIMRKICLQMYQPAATVDTRMVDDDTEEVMNGAPFLCPTDFMYPIIVPSPGNATNIWDLTDDNIVSAIDRCQLSPDHPVIKDYQRNKNKNRKGKGGGAQQKKETKARTGKGHSVQQTTPAPGPAPEPGRSQTVEMLNHLRKRGSRHRHSLGIGKAAFLDRLW